MKIAACYTVYNGFELLEKAIQQINSLVDEIIICYQVVSNKGNQCDKVLPFLQNTFLEWDKITLIEYHPDLSLNTKENERRKHQAMLELARDNGNSHIVMGACDHFYNVEEFRKARLLTEIYDWDITFTKMFTYYKNPNWQLTPTEDYYMPLFIRLHPNTKIENVKEYPLIVDPSVRVNTIDNWHLFPKEIIMLHHFSMLRIDIKNKFANAAASINWSPEQVKEFIDEYENYDIALNPGIKYFKGRKIKVTKNNFNL